ncbi:MAG TPA: hypothetical protein VMU93_04255, partial [Caulobacteraceae bacterium]|nr:hypothetical protein [Caulobacteraceae bacterium]
QDEALEKLYRFFFPDYVRLLSRLLPKAPAGQMPEAEGGAWDEAGEPASEAPAATDTTVEIAAPAKARGDWAAAQAAADAAAQISASEAPRPGDPPGLATDRTVEITASPAATPPPRVWKASAHGPGEGW